MSKERKFTARDGLLFRQLFLEVNICNLNAELETEKNEFSAAKLTRRLQRATLEAEAGRTRITDDELDTVLNMLLAMANSQLEELKQLRAFRHLKERQT